MINKDLQPNGIPSPLLLQSECCVQLIRCKNNHKAFYSKVCPFCNEKGKRPFRYNSKLKVGKAYCCGVSFKDISWLQTILTNRDKYEVKMITDSPLVKTTQARQYLIDKYFKDKLSMKQIGFEKSDNEDLSLPF